MFDFSELAYCCLAADVETILIYGRDDSVSRWLFGFEVYVGTSPLGWLEGVQCNAGNQPYRDINGPSHMANFTCDAMGQYVTIRIPQEGVRDAHNCIISQSRLTSLFD
jgi:hypothetical protein